MNGISGVNFGASPVFNKVKRGTEQAVIKTVVKWDGGNWCQTFKITGEMTKEIARKINLPGVCRCIAEIFRRLI